jgi:hypothetical protein
MVAILAISVQVFALPENVGVYQHLGKAGHPKRCSNFTKVSLLLPVNTYYRRLVIEVLRMRITSPAPS